MSKSLLNQKPPVLVGNSPQEINRWWVDVQRYLLAGMDIRNPHNDVSTGIVADTTTGTVTLGSAAVPTGKTVGLPTLFSKINDSGRAIDSSFLYPSIVSNRASVQNVSSVLTATDAGASATISVASHSVTFDFGTISYDAGTITGLLYSTTYYVYASDSAFAGGTVTWLATSNPNNLIAPSTYYAGTVTTPAALGGPVTGGGGAGGGGSGLRWRA